VRHPVCKQYCTSGQPCYLHLHGSSSWVRGNLERPSVYSAPSAPGIVMASGAALLACCRLAVALQTIGLGWLGPCQCSQLVRFNIDASRRL
jgi:hypothetical protein